MTTVAIVLLSVPVLLAASVLAVAVSRQAAAGPLIYGICLAACLVDLAAALRHLLDAGPSTSLLLPAGLPWIGAHFRIDALSAFFLSVVNVGGAAASLYALGYGRHEDEPHRVLPFFPAFLAGMNDARASLALYEELLGKPFAMESEKHRFRTNIETLRQQLG